MNKDDTTFRQRLQQLYRARAFYTKNALSHPDLSDITSEILRLQLAMEEEKPIEDEEND